MTREEELVRMVRRLRGSLKECLGYVQSDYEIRPGGVYAGEAQGTVNRAEAVLKETEGV